MNADAAEQLARRIVNTWRLTAPLSEWIDVLSRLDDVDAHAAFVRARDESEHAPSIARFMGLYRAEQRAVITPPEPIGPFVAASDPRALTAMRRGYALGRADRERMSLCRCEWCRTNLP